MVYCLKTSKKIIVSVIVFSMAFLLSKAVPCNAQQKSDIEINKIDVNKSKDSSGRVVLPHKILPASISSSSCKTKLDSLQATKKLISQTINLLESGQTAKALFTINEALSFCPKDDVRTNAIATAYYALVHIRAGSHSKSVTSLNKCDSLFRKLGDVNLLAFHYNNLGLFNQKFLSQKSAEKYFLKALAFSRAIGDSSTITATALNNLAKGEGNASLKIKYLNEAISINKKAGRTLSLGENYNNMAYQHISLGDFSKAINYLDSALVIGQKLNSQEILINNHDYRAILYAKMGNYKAAYEETIKREEAQKELSEGENISDIDELIANRLLTKKEYEINLQKKENDIRRLNLSLVITASLLIIMILTLLYIYFYINNKRHVQELESKKIAAEREVKYTQAELTNLSTYINSRNEILCNIQSSLSKAQKMDEKEVYSELRKVNLYIRNLQTRNEDVESVMNKIRDINDSFIKRLSELHPDLTKNDKNIALLLRANLSTKQIASLLDCSPKSVNMARYRMRQHLNIDSDTNLVKYLKSI
jgi:DNA-binding CsgD family transcriptional regulator/tetratricopeptide (TPR) repeat protein